MSWSRPPARRDGPVMSPDRARLTISVPPAPEGRQQGVSGLPQEPREAVGCVVRVGGWVAGRRLQAAARRLSPHQRLSLKVADRARSGRPSQVSEPSRIEGSHY